MPVTIKLSREFYERFGDRIANEFVEVLNQVDLAYRDDLRDLSEANLRRIDARFDRFEAEVRLELAQFRTEWEKFRAEMRQEMADFKMEIRGEMSALCEENTGLRSDMERGFEHLRSDMLKWMFLFWATSLLTMVGILVTVIRR
ncbi:MAG TPA: hypothetical protein VLT17_14135 [Gemmatimonadales bacterium]|nr:hypothetical protein [Gemmatimonadales bacterium]